ncbi:haloacid dehalogenase type II [Rhodococcus kroppenstedtii]|uniref:Haloacid dehalogenase type II n=2 Tax=Mycobacteriales TaxID=85007 RepID=A0ABS7NRQ2_9NOCA|nr:haloacid dehalogenase type II [Rhodococcus kroppenstedtii]AMY19442.1 (S)-2-haloacid dehalogenase [Rhodococcus sp. PBTS 1]MBY6312646.1 haloacid dehalogenase type II [Rhodococcus kroppenstedtii]MBY6320686.1 haloacid dehalogenase type II [Rhodococcus kroppenstedtii]MBY6399403.1 haloacid dehalogenase type II [Rhodococcus kroppenstedtii]MBY6435419.1 haloacid dehalogenase type II [Rhodococcus kroppenstedtii]
MMDVRVALFDVFGTVVDWRSGIASDARHWFAAHAPDRVDLDPFEFADRWRARYQPSMQPIRDGTRGFTALDVLHRENLVELLSELDLDADDEAVDALNAAWHALPPWPDSVAGLTAIRQLMPVAPLSNGNVSLLLNMARNAGLPWDTILGAQVVRAYKPTPESYLRTAELLDLEPGRCLMVAAHNDDLAAAQACGLRTAFVRRPLEHGPDGADPGPTGDWDIVVRDLVELGAVLAQTRRS